MLDIFEPCHVAAFLSPFERGDGDTPSDFAAIASLLGLSSLGEPIVVPIELQPEFELARQRLLAEAI